MSVSPNFKCHVFICESCQPSGLECAQYEEGEVSQWRKSLKKKLSEKFGKSDLRVNGAKCLGQCERGVSCVLYPQEKWLFDLRINQDDKIIEEIEKAMND